ncbi:hypothetical protein Z948_1062 [Sulfitobacter donghicola DSW-25 = KCTC 12864 = JCM 14565]|nr:hypothetical protein Z948_1062 [Sulfitobacter donghicola DSW-25 = KCTC 12864 = JCM 14565]
MAAGLKQSCLGKRLLLCSGFGRRGGLYRGHFRSALPPFA